MKNFTLYNGNEIIEPRYNNDGYIIDGRNYNFSFICDCGKFQAYTLRGFSSKRGRIKKDANIKCRSCNKKEAIQKNKRKEFYSQNNQNIKFKLFREDTNEEIVPLLDKNGKIPYNSNYYISFICEKCEKEIKHLSLFSFRTRGYHLTYDTKLLCHKCSTEKTCIEKFGKNVDGSKQKYHRGESEYDKEKKEKAGLKIVKWLSENNLLLLDKYNGSFEIRGKKYKRYRLECKTCNTVFTDIFDSQHTPLCPACYPKIIGSSRAEREIVKYIRSLGYEVWNNNRSLLDGRLEVDAYLPELNIGIEYDGFYWHKNDKNKKRKDEAALKNGIKLFHLKEENYLMKRTINRDKLFEDIRKILNKNKA